MVDDLGAGVYALVVLQLLLHFGVVASRIAVPRILYEHCDAPTGLSREISLTQHSACGSVLARLTPRLRRSSLGVHTPLAVQTFAALRLILQCWTDHGSQDGNKKPKRQAPHLRHRSRLRYAWGEIRILAAASAHTSCAGKGQLRRCGWACHHQF